jgi:hypothetical protein
MPQISNNEKRELFMKIFKEKTDLTIETAPLYFQNFQYCLSAKLAKELAIAEDCFCSFRQSIGIVQLLKNFSLTFPA